MPRVIEVSFKEGIQPDYSFHQHGQMLQFGNYGMHLLNSIIFWMSVTAGTSYDFPEDKKQDIYRYAVDGLKWTIYKGAMDITAVGRQIRNNYTLKRGINLYSDFQLLKVSDPDKSPCRYWLDGFAPFYQGCNLYGNKSFWRSAYMIQRGGDRFMMSVKMEETQVKKVEAINGENLKGTFLNDGVTLIQRTGREYKNIEALWNWDMLPGTICDTTVDPIDKKNFNSFNRSEFVGMVSNGADGISTMIYNRLGVNANKSVFLLIIYSLL